MKHTYGMTKRELRIRKMFLAHDMEPPPLAYYTPPVRDVDPRKVTSVPPWKRARVTGGSDPIRGKAVVPDRSNEICQWCNGTRSWVRNGKIWCRDCGEKRELSGNPG